MSKISNRLPRPAFVIACLALLFAVSGSAYAATVASANSVRSSSIADGEVYSRDIHNRSVKGLDIVENSLGTRVLKDRSITEVDLADDSVGTEAVQESAVGASELSSTVLVTANSPATSDVDGQPNGGAQGVAKATATCPADSRLISGGARWVDNTGNNTNDAAVYLQEQYRSGSNAWTVEGVVDFGAQGTIRLQAQVLCLNLGGVVVP